MSASGQWPILLAIGESVAVPFKMQEHSAKPASNLHHVQIIETEASIGCGLRPSTLYELTVELSQIVLQQDNTVLVLWPLKYVRRFGYTSNSFSIEAGSKCETGEGLFIFRSPQAIKLYNLANESVAKIKQIKSRQLQRNMPQPSMPSLEQTAVAPAESPKWQGSQPSWFLPNPARSRLCPNPTNLQMIPHYMRNNCEYAQIIKRRSKSTVDQSLAPSNIPLLRMITRTKDYES